MGNHGGSGEKLYKIALSWIHQRFPFITIF